jgi:hypothetical protein
LSAENYISDLFDKREGFVYHRSTRDAKISFLNKREKYIFPLLPDFKNLKASYINNPQVGMLKNVKSKKLKDNYILELDFGGVLSSNNEFGAKITY